jgi:SAM-dependent methyltransferase
MAAPTVRDTDADWRRIGEAQPYWGVLSGERYRTENIDEAALNDFYGSGQGDIQAVVERASRFLGAWPAPRRALDFGCGVGRLVYAMTPYAEEVVGYDVSPEMLSKAESRNAESLNNGHVRFTSAWPKGGFDWINSYIVFQHIPPQRGLELLEKLLGQLNPGGLVSLHFTVYRDARLEPTPRPYAAALKLVKQCLGRPTEPPAGSVSMFDYDLSKILAALVRGGVSESAMLHLDHNGHHGVQIIGRRG